MKYKYQAEKDKYIEFRSLSAEEADRMYVAVMSGNPYAEEFVFNAITMDKYDIDDLSAGIITNVVYSAFKLSGYYAKQEDIANTIDNARSLYENNIYHKMFYSKIMKIVPGVYKLEELKTKTLNELLELYVLCESVIDGQIHDTAKMREILASTEEKKTKPKSKIINMITKEELSALKASLQAEEFDGMPIGGL